MRLNKIFFNTVDGKTKIYTTDWWPRIIKYSYIILYNIFGRYLCRMQAENGTWRIRDAATATCTGWYCRRYRFEYNFST